MNDKKIHSADLEPDGKNESHYLLINGERVARYTSPHTALKAREQFLMPFIEQEGPER
jgi:hypothetical protein